VGINYWIGCSRPIRYDGVFSRRFDMDKSLGDQVTIILYYRLEDLINGEKSRESAPTQFVVRTRWSKKIEDIKETNFGTYIEYSMWVFIFWFNRFINFDF